MNESVVERWIRGFVFWLSVAICGLKTSELMAHFAPDNIFGFTGVAGYYGFACMLLIEGLFVVMKYRLERQMPDNARIITGVFAGILWGVSFIAQGLDSIVMDGAIETLPVEMQLLVTWIIPAVPALVMGAMALADAVYSPTKAGPRQQPQERRPFIPQREPARMMSPVQEDEEPKVDPDHPLGQRFPQRPQAKK